MKMKFNMNKQAGGNGPEERGSSAHSGVGIRGQSGFTLVELLIVMMIIGLLAAIAIPSYFNQRDKAHDADAKVGARLAQTTIESYAADNRGRYSGAGIDELVKLEPSLANFDVSSVAAGDDTYIIVSASKSGINFTITRNDNGTFRYECDDVGTGACPQSGVWSGSPLQQP